MKKIKAIILMVCVLIIGVCGYSYLQLNIDLVPKITSNLNQNEMFKESVDWNIPYFFNLLNKNVKEKRIDNNAPITINENNLEISVNHDDAHSYISVKHDDTIIYEGSIDDFNDNFLFINNGEYTINNHVTFTTDELGNGDIYFKQKVNVDINEVKYNLTLDNLLQGQLSCIKISNVPNDIIPVGKSDLGQINFVKTDVENQYMAIIPTSYTTDVGDYAVQIHLGSNSKEFIINVSENEFVVQNLKVSQTIAKDTTYSDEANAEFAMATLPLTKSYSDEIYWESTFVQPVFGKISTPYGVIRYVNDDPVSRRHGGVDFAVPLGTPVQAPNNGVVEFAQFLKLTGNTIVIDHGAGLKSYFYHLDSISVEVNDTVKKTDIIGKVGTTGFSTGAHLHYELRIGDKCIDPFPLFDNTSTIY